MACSCTIEKFSAWECHIQTLVRSYVCLFKAAFISLLHELAASGRFVQKWIIWCISLHIVCFCFPVANKFSYLFYKCVLAFPLVMYHKSFKLADVICDTVRIWERFTNVCITLRKAIQLSHAACLPMSPNDEVMLHQVIAWKKWDHFDLLFNVISTTI